MKQFTKYGMIGVIMLLLTSTMAFAQKDEKVERPQKDKEPFYKRLVLGGQFGGTFGTITNVNLSPTLGYRITDQFIAGVGMRYIYSSDKRFVPTYKQSIYGPQVFARYLVFQGLFVHSEYEHLFFKARQDNFIVKTDAPALLVGAGYSNSFGRGPSFFAQVLYDILHTSDSFYGSPLRVQFGFGFGF